MLAVTGGYNRASENTHRPPSERSIMELTKLGNQDAEADGVLERIEVDTSYGSSALTVELYCTEFTCRCPVTKQPDWADLRIKYQAKNYVVESKSIKLYLETYRDVGIFHEHLAQKILKDLVTVIAPLWCEVEAIFNTRGGIAITATASWVAVEG